MIPTHASTTVDAWLQWFDIYQQSSPAMGVGDEWKFDGELSWRAITPSSATGR
jgi:hypothetical protein